MQNVNNKVNYTENSRFDISIFSFFIITMILCFVTTENIENPISVFYLSANKASVLIAATTIFALLNLLRKPYFDKLTVTLIASATLGIIPLMYAMNTGSYWGNFLPLIITVFAYFVSSQTKGEFTNSIYKIVCLIIGIISIQVLLTEYNHYSTISLGNFNDVYMKALMSIPIGYSNLIAAILLPLIVFVTTYKVNKYSIVLLPLALYALILCRSKNAIILISVFLLFILIKKVYLYIFNDKSVGRPKKLIALSVVTMFFIAVAAIVFDRINVVVTGLQFTGYISPYSNPFWSYLDSISSGRIMVYHSELLRASDHLFFGNGFGYDLGQTKSHNWLIELLVQKGIIGLCLYLMGLYFVFKTGFKYYKTDKFIRASVNMLMVVFIQGLFEISVFTMGVDFLIWSFAGLIIARARWIKRNGTV